MYFFSKTTVFKKFVILVMMVNDNPLLTIVNDDPLLTSINIIVNKNLFFKNDHLFKSDHS